MKKFNEADEFLFGAWGQHDHKSIKDQQFNIGGIYNVKRQSSGISE